jgi:hypothetical protein
VLSPWARLRQVRLIIPGVLLMLAVAGCGDGSAASDGDENNVVIKPYDTVTIDTSLGEGSILEIRGARSTVDHELEVLVDGFSCGRPSRVEVEETADGVEVLVRGALIGDGDCPSDIVPWFVPVELTDPLSNREVTTTGGNA